ncbi:MAG: phage major tail tube protein [Alistipes sp.]|nr:phage major tail tube protein [Alistipes sp.]
MAQIAKVCNANAYVNNVNTHGLAVEFTLPDITPLMADHDVLGMFGSIELANGLDKMEAAAKWSYPSNDLLVAFADVHTSVEIMLRSNKAVYEDGTKTDDVPIVANIRGTSKGLPGGTFKAKENTELDTTFAVNYFKLEVDGQELYEVDIMNNIYKVDGVDKLAALRENLGI